MNKEVIPVTEIPKFQSRAEEFFPIQWYKEMLNNSPVYFHEETNTWNVFQYEHVKQVLSNYEFFQAMDKEPLFLLEIIARKKHISNHQPYKLRSS